MSEEEQALRSLIEEDPSPENMYVYADWLEENSRPEADCWRVLAKHKEDGGIDSWFWDSLAIMDDCVSHWAQKMKDKK